ncbi:MAG: biotin/lipoyl-containing protein, partial [Woeseiaceae bacterium]
MTIEIKVPPLPESVSDATLVAWHKKPGEAVSRDENLVDLETDKVVLEVPAPASGTIGEIMVENGATVVAGDVLALLEEGAAAAPPPPAAKKAEAPVAEATDSGPTKMSPAVRRLLEEHDLDATIVIGSGKDGRITKSDVVSYLKTHSDENVTPG